MAENEEIPGMDEMLAESGAGEDVSGEPVVVNLGQDESDEEGETGAGRTLAFLIDPEASPLAVRETALSLIAAYHVERVVTDVTSLAGIAVAQAAETAGVPFSLLDYGQENRSGEASAAEHERLSVICDGVHHAELGTVASIPANLVLVPTTQAEEQDGPSAISLGLDSLPGIALQQLQETGEPCLLMLPPEAGLATEGSHQDPERVYVRKLLHARG